MDFDFSAEQVMLREMARDLLSAHAGAPAIRRLMEDPTGYDEQTWHQLAETGLLGVTIPERHGGQGLGMVELAIVLEEMGRAAYPGPYFASVVLAAAAITAGGSESQMAAYLPKIASGELKASMGLFEQNMAWGADATVLRAEQRGGGYTLNGAKWFVPFAHAADILLIPARSRSTGDPTRGITIFAVERDATGVTLRPEAAIDQTSKSSTVTLEDVQVGREQVIGQAEEGWDVLQAVQLRAAIGAAAEMLGAERKCLDMSVEYAKVREQFGQKIGAFQAIKHYCADMLVEVENSHAATYYAAWALDAQASDAALAASVAKAYVSEAARKVCGQSIQVHGGIGFTWDYDLHLYFKRAKHLEALYGDADTHRELILRESLQPTGLPVLA